MSRLFISHAPADNAKAAAIKSRLAQGGWVDVYFESDEPLETASGARWERALKDAARSCEAVLFLISPAWLASDACQRHLNLAQRFNKRLIGAVIDPIDISASLSVAMPVVDLSELDRELQRASLNADAFEWPPASDPGRAPYRGLRTLDEKDAGVFFGRQEPTVEMMDRLRGLRLRTAPRVLVICGGPGEGKSSFLRAGLLPRLARDERNFMTLPVLRPDRAAVTGSTGLIRSLEGLASRCGLRLGDLTGAIAADAPEAGRSVARFLGDARVAGPRGESGIEPPSLVLSIDQGEELFASEADRESVQLLRLLRGLIIDNDTGLIVVVTMRPEPCPRLAVALGIGVDMLSLPPMSFGEFHQIIEGPAWRSGMRVEPELARRLDNDLRPGPEALPRLAFTLQQVYLAARDRGDEMRAVDYEGLGGMESALDTVIEGALRTASATEVTLADLLISSGMVDIDPHTGEPRCRPARAQDVPASAITLANYLVMLGLLVTRKESTSGDATVELVHESVLFGSRRLLGGLARQRESAAAQSEGAEMAREVRRAAGKTEQAVEVQSTDELMAARYSAERPRPARASARAAAAEPDSALAPFRSLTGPQDRILPPPTVGRIDEVDCSVFAPIAARAGAEALIQVFLHDKDQAEAARGRAVEADRTIDRQITRSLDTEIARGTRVQIFLDAAGLIVPDGAPLEQSLIWRGQPTSCAFRVQSPRGLLPRSFHPSIRIAVGGTLIGAITFAIRCSLFPRTGMPLLAAAGTPRAYKTAFVSYASKDRYEVLRRIQGLRAAMEVRQDVLDLDPADRYGKLLFEWIADCDLFLLCWSQAAKDSKWVLKEARYALACHRRSKGVKPDIVPLVLEGPPPVPPPRWLAHLHFNDPVCYFMAVERKGQTSQGTPA